MTHSAKPIVFGALLLTIMVLGACTSPFDGPDHQAWRTTDDATLHARLAGVSEAASESAPALADDATVDDYVRLALQRNPSIRAAEHRIERMGARIPQVTALDDPMFQVAPIGEMAETAAGQVGLMTSVSQKLPFPGKLDARGRIAEQDVAMAAADLQQLRLQVIADTRRAFWGYYFTTRAIQTTTESRSLLDQFRQIAEAQYKAGSRGQTDVLRASIELSGIDGELITLARQQATARSMINQLTDRPIDAAVPTPPIIVPEQVTARLDELLASAAQHNPAIGKIHQRIEQARQQQRLAKLGRRPDLTISATYNAVDDRGMSMAANGRDQWWFGFGVNLPIWADKLDAADREALHARLEAAADLAAQRNRVAFDVQDAYLKVQAQQKLVELFRDVIIPQAKQTVEASAAGYRAGGVDFLMLIDNWRKRVNFDVMYHRAVAELQQAAADLERAVGREVASAPAEQTP